MDAVLLYSETPNVHMHTLKIATIDFGDLGGHRIGIDAFRSVIGGRLYKLEPFRYQLVSIPYKLHHPMWRENCEVDLNYHIRPMTLPAPGGRRELNEAIGRIASTPLDRSRPLWEMYFIDGLAGGRYAVVGKIHHALADGVASGNLMARGMDLQSGPDPDSDYPTDPALGKLELVRLAMADHQRQIGRIPGVIAYTVRGMRRVRRSNRKLSPELTRPFTPPATFLNHIITSERRFATATLALSDVKETSKALGITINDLVLTVCTGALRTLLLRYEGSADHPLIGSVPVSYDFDANRVTGNRFTGMLAPLPVSLSDPIERARETHAAAELAKESFQLVGPELTSRWANYLPPVVAEALFRRANRDGKNKIFNVTISNVPGPRAHGRVGGALVTEFYSVGPLSAGCALNITVWSYVDQVNISVITDDATVDDEHEVPRAMLDEFSSLRAAVGLSPELTSIPSVMPQV